MTEIFAVSDECRRLGLRAGAVLFRGVHVAPRGDALESAIAEGIASVRARFSDLQAVRECPEVAAFHEVLRTAGIKPRKLQPSVERLLSFALRRGDLPAINNLVDAYNLASVRTLCSLGAHDLDRIALPITLRLLTGEESFTPLGKESLEPVTRGEFGYVDAANRVVCRLDVLQADFSKVTEAASNVLVIIEGTERHAHKALEHAFAEAIEMITRHCGASAAEIISIRADDRESSR